MFLLVTVMNIYVETTRYLSICCSNRYFWVNKMFVMEVGRVVCSILVLKASCSQSICIPSYMINLFNFWYFNIHIEIIYSEKGFTIMSFFLHLFISLDCIRQYFKVVITSDELGLIIFRTWKDETMTLAVKIIISLQVCVVKIHDYCCWKYSGGI